MNLTNFSIGNNSFANATVYTGALQSPSTDPRVVAWIVASLLTNGFGIVSNTLLILSLLVHKPLRQSSSCSLIIHSIAIDLYATAVAIPIDTIPVYLGPDWPLPKNFCRYQVTVPDYQTTRQQAFPNVQKSGPAKLTLCFCQISSPSLTE